MSGSIFGTLISQAEGYVQKTVSNTISTISSSAGSVLASATSLATTANNQATSENSMPDLRVRLSALSPSTVYGPQVATNLLNPLWNTNGLIFPFSPTLQFSQDVTYQASSMVHTNMDYEAYVRTPSVTITLAGKFTVQNRQEGQYALAAIHFLRVASKMYFGTAAKDRAGLPPPMLVLNGYGKYMFNGLRVILKAHNYSFDETMDTVAVYASDGSIAARLPALFTLSCTLVVQQTPSIMKNTFDLDAFRTGALIASGKGFI